MCLNFKNEKNTVVCTPTQSLLVSNIQNVKFTYVLHRWTVHNRPVRHWN